MRWDSNSFISFDYFLGSIYNAHCNTEILELTMNGKEMCSNEAYGEGFVEWRFGGSVSINN